MKRVFRNIIGFFAIGFTAGCILIFFCDHLISSYGKYSFDESKTKLSSRVGLVLGTSKYTRQGTVNLFYKYRLESAIQLYESCTIEKILVSGDNGSYSYNEPIMFYKDLVEAGIPKEDIYLDYAGFRTFDSVVRAKEVFQQNQFLVISQRFHNERALFIARQYGIEAYAYNAPNVSFNTSPKTYIREKLARVKAVLDVYILGTQPKYLGEKIKIS